MRDATAHKRENLKLAASCHVDPARQTHAEYLPKFTVLKANKLFAESLTHLEADSPDMISVLQTIEKLAKVIQDASYDHSVLKNLITENRLLAEECFKYRREQ